MAYSGNKVFVNNEIGEAPNEVLSKAGVEVCEQIVVLVSEGSDSSFNTACNFSLSISRAVFHIWGIPKLPS